MRKLVVPVAVLLIVLLMASGGLATGSATEWWTEFTYDAGTWPEGDHTYWIVAEGAEHLGHGFTISSAAPSFEGTVLLRGFHALARTDSLDRLNCEPVDPFLSPDQPTRFHIGWRTAGPMTYEAAVAYFDSLELTAVWDDGHSARLVRHEIRPYESHKILRDQFCAWTTEP